MKNTVNTFDFKQCIEERIKEFNAKWVKRKITYNRTFIKSGKEPKLPDWLPVELRSYYNAYKELTIFSINGIFKLNSIDKLTKHYIDNEYKLDGKKIKDEWAEHLVNFNGFYYHLQEEKVILDLDENKLLRLEGISLSEFIRLKVALLGTRNWEYLYAKNKSNFNKEIKQFQTDYNTAFTGIVMPSWIDFKLPKEFNLE